MRNKMCNRHLHQWKRLGKPDWPIDDIEIAEDVSASTNRNYPSRGNQWKKRKCHATRKDGSGDPCPNWAITGGFVCQAHGGRVPAVKRAAAVRAELTAWGFNDEILDPGSVLLKLLAQSSRRVELYSSLLEEQYAKADNGDTETTLPARVGTLIGREYALNSEGRPVPIKEAIRGLVELEGLERDRCGRLASIALNAGLEERRVRLAEQAGAMISGVLKAVLSDPRLGLTEEQRAAFPAVARAHLAIA
jgi:hypothetical protein